MFSASFLVDVVPLSWLSRETCYYRCITLPMRYVFFDCVLTLIFVTFRTGFGVFFLGGRASELGWEVDRWKRAAGEIYLTKYREVTL